MNRIILLAANDEDATRWLAQSGEPFELAGHAYNGQSRCVDMARTHGARIIRTDRWVYDERVVGALRAINARTPLVDPTGLLGTDSSGRDDTGRRHPVRGEPTHADRPTGRVRRS